VNRRVAVGRIHHIPVTARDLADQRKQRVPQQAQAGHALQERDVVEPVALDVVGVGGEQRPDEGRNHRRIHLSVAVDFHNDIGAVGKCRFVAGDHRATHATVLGMEEDNDAGVGRALPNQFAALLRARVVDDEDARNLGADAFQHAEHAPTHTVARDDDRDARAGVHRQPTAISTPTRITMPPPITRHENGSPRKKCAASGVTMNASENSG
jgi:hypothetical protein